MFLLVYHTQKTIQMDPGLNMKCTVLKLLEKKEDIVIKTQINNGYIWLH